MEAMQLKKPSNGHYDAYDDVLNSKEEIKALRATASIDHSKYNGHVSVFEDAPLFIDRALVSIPEDHLSGVDTDGNVVKLSNGSFQQSKPDECDYFILVAVFLNLTRAYVVKAGEICSEILPTSERKETGLICMSHQHRNKNEGHLLLSYVKAHCVYETDIRFGEIRHQKLSLKKMIEKLDDNSNLQRYKKQEEDTGPVFLAC